VEGAERDMPNDDRDAASLARSLHDEMRVRHLRRLPALAGPLLVSDGYLDLTRDAFRFRSPGGAQFHYARGAGIAAIRPEPALADEFELFLWGTVFGAVAWLNGFFALHASAVELEGRAIAFTADSGGGKSTIAAALAGLGMPHLCDDTLPLARCGGRFVAIPDNKPIKLWSDGLLLTGTGSVKSIDAVPGKHFARPALRASAPLPLADLVILEDNPTISLVRLKGSAALAAIAGSLYRAGIAQALVAPGIYGELMLDMGRAVRVWRLGRPRVAGDRAVFAESTRVIAETLGTLGSRNTDL
jgi:hypothetical protein